MRVKERLDLIDRIARKLQAEMSFVDIDIFLANFGIPAPQNVGSNSKWVYGKAALGSVPTETILRIAAELDMPQPLGQPPGGRGPRNWKSTTKLRLFMSHISKDKLKATRLRECLDPFAISGFVAHEDIHPTLEWQDEVERALWTMDAFVAILTPGFSASVWTQQEIGFALGRGTKIISLRMGEDPTGFISKHQALPRRGRTAEQIAAEIDVLLAADPLTSGKLGDARKSNQPAMPEEIPF